MQSQFTQKIIIIQNFFERMFMEHYLEIYREYCGQDSEYDPEFFEDFSEISWDAFNSEMKHFSEEIEHELRYGDSLGVNVYEVIAQGFYVIACVVGTDGDNGWLFVFSADGELLSAGYTYIDVIEWVSAAMIQRYQGQRLDGLFEEIVAMGGDRGKSLWGRPLAEAEAIVQERIQICEARQV